MAVSKSTFRSDVVGMLIVMNGLIPAPKGRVRTKVGHKYLEVLQSKVDGGYQSSSSSSSDDGGQGSPGLNLLILGITSGTAMDDIDFALCRYTQESPEAPLYLDLIQVYINQSCSVQVG